MDTRPIQSYIILDASVEKKQLEAANRIIFTAKGKYFPFNGLCVLWGGSLNLVAGDCGQGRRLEVN
jgi:hypothetical protein